MSAFEFFYSLVSFGTLSCTSGGTTHAWELVWSRGEDLFVGAWSPVDGVEVATWPGGNVPPDREGWRKIVVGGLVRYERATTVIVVPSELCAAYDPTVEIPGDQEQVAPLRHEAEVSNYPRVVLTSWARGHEAPSFAACDRWNEPVTVSMLPPPFVESKGGAIGIISLT